MHDVMDGTLRTSLVPRRDYSKCAGLRNLALFWLLRRILLCTYVLLLFFERARVTRIVDSYFAHG